MNTTTESPPSIGLVAGKYQLLGLIGRGGMGSVWEGRHATLGTRVAIKFIEAEYANSQDARSRFDNEARAAATIQSKHAIQIFDHGVTEDGKPYIVMEMLIGEPLEKRLDRMGRLPLQDTARVIMQVSRALRIAHDKGIIHRDLKPENIFLVRSQDDDDEIAKVLDFGIAKMKANPGEMGVSSGTKTGAVLGTPFYMSPEQARGLRTIDHRTDIWSLGVIAFKCATGKLPFDGESVGDLLVKICTSPIPVPSRTFQGLPPNFDAWFMRVMEREPDRRFGTVQEMSDALAYAAGITMRQPNSAGGGMQMSAQHGGTMALGGGTQRQSSVPNFNGGFNGGSSGGMGTGGGMTPTPALSGTQSPFTTSAQPPIPKSNKGVVFASVAIAAVILGGAIGGAFYVNNAKKEKEAAATALLLEASAKAQAPPPLTADTLTKIADPPKTDVTNTPDTMTAPLTNGQTKVGSQNAGKQAQNMQGTASSGNGGKQIAQAQSHPGTQQTHPGGVATQPTATAIATAATVGPIPQPTHTAAAVPVPTAKGKVEESGY